MSLIDFNQEAKDQGCLHIAVIALGDASAALFQAVMKELSLLPPIQLVEPKGTVLFLRFLNSVELPSWALVGPKWNEFSAHKQILGVLGISQCLDVDDLDNVMAGFKSYCAKFKSSLCDSRCIVYGSRTEMRQHLDPRKGYRLVDLNSEQESYTSGDINVDDIQEIVTDFALAIYITLKSRIVQLEKNISSALGRSESVKLLKSPFESKEFSRPDEDAIARPYNHMKARVEKLVADMHLLTGNLHKAFSCYENAFNTLKNPRDNLWSAAASEGLAATAVVMKLCEELLGQKAHGFPIVSPAVSSLLQKKRIHTSASSPGISHTHGSVTFDPRRRFTDRSAGISSDISSGKLARYATVKRPPSTASKESYSSEDSIDGQNGLVMRVSGNPSRQDSLSNYIDSDDEVDGMLDNVDEEEDGDYEDEQGIATPKRPLQKDFIVTQYSVALRFYAKAKLHGAVSHLEALLKFAKYLIEQKRYTMASETLHRMLKIDDPSFITDQDKLKLYCTMANLYLTMGFNRKAAMFTHYAARWATSIANSTEQICCAHQLLSNCLPGFKLSQEVPSLLEMKATHNGWPVLQAQVLKDFVFLSRRRQADVLAIRHSCYLLQNLCKHLSTSELCQVTSMLEEIVDEATENANKNSKYAATMIGKLESPFPLLNFPKVTSVTIIPFMSQLAPIKFEGFVSPKTPGSVVVNKGPFIFSPFEAKRLKEKQRPEILWVVGNPGEILMIIENPHSFDLRVAKMTVLMEGSKADTFPTSLTLPAQSDPQDIKLLTVPTESGLLDVKGYEATVFGIRHECKVKIPNNIMVRVVPPLPEMRLRLFPVILANEGANHPLSPKREGNFVRTDAKRSSKSTVTQLELLDGESCKYEFQVECLKEVDVEKITLTVADYDRDFCQFSWENDAIESLLPLSKGSPRSFFVTAIAKIPAWFRVLNDHTQGISKTTVFPSRPQSQNESRCESLSASNTPTGTPTSSPTLKHPRYQTGKFFSPRSTSKSAGKPSKMDESDDPYSRSKDSSLVDSLNLDHPSLKGSWGVGSSNTLPSSIIRRSPGHQRNPSLGNFGKRKLRGSVIKKTSGKEALEDDDWFAKLDDKKRASMVSTRSDPGEREEGISLKNRFTLKSRGSGAESTKSVPIPLKGEPRMQDPLSTSPFLHSETMPVSPTHSYQSQSGLLSGKGSADLPRTGSGSKGPGNRKQHPPLTKGLISVPFGPLMREKPQPPSRKRIVGEFKLQYTGGGGYLEGYCREAFANLPVVVKPCLIFERFNILSVESSRHLFMLKFTTHNISKSRLEISLTVEHEYDGGNEESSLTLDPNGQRDTRLAIKRFVLSDLSSSGNKSEGETANLYSKKLSEVIRIHWKNLEFNKVGVVSLDGLRVPISNLSLMRPVPLLFGLSVNGHAMPVRKSYLQELGLGVQLKLSVTLTNSSGICMPPSFLSFEPYMYSQQQKRILKDLSHMMLHSGNLVTSVPQLEPDKSYQHEITLVFLHNGNFQMEVKSYTLMINSSTKAAKSNIEEKHSTTEGTRTTSTCTKTDSQKNTTSTERSSATEPSKDATVTVNDTASPATHLQQEKNQESPATINKVSPTGTSEPSPSGTPNNISIRDSGLEQNGCLSPPLPLSKPTSPRRASSSPTPPGGNVSPRNKALLLAKKYEQDMAARAALIYTEQNVSPSHSRKKDDQSVIDSKSGTSEYVSKGDASPSHPRDVSGVETQVKNLTADAQTKKVDNSSSPKTNTASNKNILSSVQRDLLLKKRYDNISSCLPVTYLPKPVTVFPLLVNVTTCVKSSPLVHPKSDHVNDHHIPNKSRTERTMERESSHSRFQKLLNARSQSAKSVRVVSGPQFTFNIS